MLTPAFLTVIIIGLFILANAIRILREYERGIIFRLGRLIGAKGPGLILLIPVVDRMVKVSLRVVTMDVPSQDVITKDNVTVKVNAVIYFRVIDASKAIVAVEDFLYATSMIAQTTLRSVLGGGGQKRGFTPGDAKSHCQTGRGRKRKKIQSYSRRRGITGFS